MMDAVIVGGRQVGKTTKLIEWAARNNGIIIVHSASFARIVKRMAGVYGMEIPDPICYEQINNYLGSKRQFAVDDAEAFLLWMTKLDVRMMVCGGLSEEIVTLGTPIEKMEDK